jgi:hypothetical protein
MAKRTLIKKVDVTTIAQFKDELIKVSKEHPAKLVAASMTFGTMRVYAYANRSSVPVDSPTSRTMLDTIGIIGYKNGKAQKPTASWRKRNHKQETSYGGHD